MSAVTRDKGVMTLPHISEWAFGFPYIPIYLRFSQKVNGNVYTFICHALCLPFVYALLVAYVYMFGVADAHVSAR